MRFLRVVFAIAFFLFQNFLSSFCPEIFHAYENNYLQLFHFMEIFCMIFRFSAGFNICACNTHKMRISQNLFTKDRTKEWEGERERERVKHLACTQKVKWEGRKRNVENDMKLYNKSEHHLPSTTQNNTSGLSNETFAFFERKFITSKHFDEI